MKHIAAVRQELHIPARTAAARLLTAEVPYCQAPRTHLAVVSAVAVVVRMQVVEMRRPGKLKPEKRSKWLIRVVAENNLAGQQAVRPAFQLLER